MTATPTDELELRVAARSPAKELAAAISHGIYDGRPVVLRAIGAGAVNQAVKALVVAQGYVSQRGLVIGNRPGFITVPMDGEERTAIVFHVFVVR
jgi:stage V sporulation protein S